MVTKSTWMVALISNDMVKMKSRSIGILSLFGATFAYGWYGILSRSIGFTLPLLYQNSIRSLITSFLFLIFLLSTKGFKAMTLANWEWVSIRSLFNIAASVLFFVAVNYLPIGTMYFIFYSGITITGYVVGKILFKESLTPANWFSLGLAIIGLGLIYTFAVQGNPLYILLALASGICASLWNILSKKLPESLDPAQVSFADNLAACVLGLAISLILKESWVLPSLSPGWIANYTYGVLQVVTGILVVIGFRKVEANVGSIVMLSEVLFGIIFGYLLYKETISPTAFIGGTLIIASIVMPELVSMRKKSEI